MKYLIIGLIVGIMITLFFEFLLKKKPVGNLVVVKSDENYIFLDLDKDVSNLVNNDTVLLKIKTKDTESRK